MAIVKSLVILLRGNTSRLTSDFKPASKAIQGLKTQFTSTFTNVGLKIAGLAGAIVGVTSLAGAMMKLNSQFAKIDELAKAADKIGMTVAEMQALELAAGLAGSDVAAAEKAMLKFSQTLGRAQTGDTAAIEALDQIGLSVADFQNLSAIESFGLVSDSINQLGTQAQQTAAVMDIFGRGGTEIFNLIRGGSAAVQQAQADIQELGLELSRVDAAKVEMANDAWTRMQMLINGVFQQIAVALAPVFTALIETVLEMAKQSGFMGTVATTALEAITIGIEIVSRSFNFMMGVIRLVQTLFVSFFSLVLNGLAQVEKALIYLGGQQFDFGIANLASEVDKVMMDLGRKMENNFGQAFGTNDFVEKFKQKLDDVAARSEDIVKNIDTKPFAEPLEPEIEIKEENIKGNLNVQSAERGSQEAFATIFGQQRGPLQAIVDATKEGNQILVQIGQKLDRNQMPQLAIAGDVFP